MTSSIEVVISPAADRDIRQVLIYTDETWDTGQRDAYRQVLFDAFSRIAAFPETGRPAQHGP
jgi:plasmid stabilization system protein ParE